MNTKLQVGWLDPGGILVPCNPFDHSFFATQLVKQYNYPCENKWHASDTMLKRGWVQITIANWPRKEWRIHWDRAMTEAQIKFLEPYFDDVLPASQIDYDKYKDEKERFQWRKFWNELIHLALKL